MPGGFSFLVKFNTLIVSLYYIYLNCYRANGSLQLCDLNVQRDESKTAWFVILPHTNHFPTDSSIKDEQSATFIAFASSIVWYEKKLWKLKLKQRKECAEYLIISFKTYKPMTILTRIRVDQFRNGHYLHKEQQAQAQELNALAHQLTCARNLCFFSFLLDHLVYSSTAVFFFSVSIVVVLFLC